MDKTPLTDVLGALNYWWAEANNPRNDGWVQQGYKDRLKAVRNSLDDKRPPSKFEKTNEEMCF